MSAPVRIRCISPADLPPVEKIRGMTELGKHVVFEFPAELRINKYPIINQLSKSLPDHSVFDSGGIKDSDWITVMPVIATKSVQLHAIEIKSAVSDYIEMVSRLLSIHAERALPQEWSSYVHGEHIRFENASTAQVVEAPIGGPPNPDKVDPYFFSEFVKSTPNHSEVALLIKHDFHDAARMLDVLFRSPG